MIPTIPFAFQIVTYLNDVSLFGYQIVHHLAHYKVELSIVGRHFSYQSQNCFYILFRLEEVGQNVFPLCLHCFITKVPLQD